MEMRSFDILGFILPVLGAYGIVFSVRFFLPCNTIRHVSAALNQVELLVNRVEAINRIPNASEYRTNLAMCEDPCGHRHQFTDCTIAALQTNSHVFVWRAIALQGFPLSSDLFYSPA
jgi:hypothetical protein